MNTLSRPAKEYFGLAFCSMLISLGFGHLFLISGLRSSTTSSILGGMAEAEMALILALLGLVGTTLFYVLLFQRREFEARLVFAVILGPSAGILVVVVSQMLLLSVVREMNALAVAIVILLSLYLSAFSAVFLVAGWLSRTKRNVMYVIYGSIVGGFIGIGLSSVILIIILIVIAAYDLLVVSSGLLANIGGDLSKKSAISGFGYSSASLDTGVGDFIFNSSLPAHVYVHFGIELLAWTALLILAGYVLNFRVALKRGSVGGISAPTLLGVIPILISLISKAVWH